MDAAIDRWERERLLAPELAEALREEARVHSRRSATRAVRYVLAATGALILLLAVAVLGDWLWPRIQAGGRSALLALVGAGVHLTGLYLRRGERWRAASYVLQITGLLILLGTYVYSEAAWSDGTAGGLMVGILALATPLLTAPRSLLRRDPVMPAAHLALGLAFLAVFLKRGFGLPADATVWVLDAVLVVLALLLVRALRGARGAAEADWALNAFAAALYSGFVLVAFTGLGPLGLDEAAVYPLNLWLLGMVALTLWGIHAAPPALQRGWYERQLAFAVLLGVPLAFVTALGAWEAPPEVAALLVAAVGALGLRWAVRHEATTTLASSCLALLVAAWYYGVARGGALGVALALAASAALLFWVSTRVGRER